MAYTFHDLAFDVLKQTEKPLTYQEIWEKAEELNLTGKIKSYGKTPWKTLSAILFIDVQNNPESKFIKVGKLPTRFFLKEKKSDIPDDIIKKIEIAEARPEKKKGTWHERDLHSLLTYFVYANPSFGRRRGILTKTIFHEGSKKTGYNKWLYPDLVGFYLPLEDWESELIELGKSSNNNLIRLYSFELKKSLDKGNYKEAFFQAVSNSSWAHEGYLVASEIKQDDDFLAELERLRTSFGIGIIHLDLKDFDSSSVLYPAIPKTSIDWETMNKICAQNDDFRKFIQDIKIDFESKQIHKSEYDKVLVDPNKYIDEKFKVY